MKFHILLIGLFLCFCQMVSALPENHFVLTWNTNLTGGSNNTSITIKTDPSFSYEYKVDWNNDGTFDSPNITGDVTHTYDEPGIYTIRIFGLFPAIVSFGNSDRSKLISVDQWGSNQWLSMKQAFMGCKNLSETPSGMPDLSFCTSLESMFSGCELFNSNINHWDVSNITDLSFMFFLASSFNQPLSNWDVSNVTTLYYTFGHAEQFNQNINSWNVSSVDLFFGTFFHASIFNKPLYAWDISSANDMSLMFQGASSFNQNINTWNLDGVLYLFRMFKEATSYNQDMSSWDMSTVLNVRSMFELAFSFDQNLGAWDMSNVYWFDNIFEDITLSTENYDAALSWDMSGIDPGSTFGGSNSYYCLSQGNRRMIMETYDITFTDGGKDPNGDCDIELDIRACLQGPFDHDLGQMSNTLAMEGELPIADPYGDLGFTHVNGAGSVSNVSVLMASLDNNSIVDWIFVELRDGNDPTKVLQTRSGLIQKDRDIVDVDGFSNLSFYNPLLSTDKVIIAVRHRNHLGIRNADPLDIEPVIELNLSSQNVPLFGGADAGVNLGGIINMKAGDANSDGTVNAGDKNIYWQPENGGSYSYPVNKGDFNMDASVNSIDKNFFWRLNNGQSTFLD